MTDANPATQSMRPAPTHPRRILASPVAGANAGSERGARQKIPHEATDRVLMTVEPFDRLQSEKAAE
jgi:hypothetical protein